MKVAKNINYGAPSLIKIADQAKPLPKPTEILVKIYYSSVNRTDVGFLRGQPFVTRFFTGLLRPKYESVGCEFSGIVEAIGGDVTLFKPGDKVFGFDDQHFGGYAEYKVIDQNKMVESIPHDITLQQAAVALEGAHYALFYIYKIGDPKTTKVFVNGGTGGIGSAAVQLLKAKGYYVEASSTTKHLNTVNKLGADKVIDWQTQDITTAASRCDVYFDAVGKSTFKQARRILKRGGLYMSSELGPMGQNPILSLINPLQRLFTKRNILFPIPSTNKKEATSIKNYLADGSFKPLIDSEYTIDDIEKAFVRVESGQKVGNVLIKVDFK